jgi:hypothetical protein
MLIIACCSASSWSHIYTSLLIYLGSSGSLFSDNSSTLRATTMAEDIYTSVSLPVALRGVVESFVFLYLGLLLLFVFVLRPKIRIHSLRHRPMQLVGSNAIIINYKKLPKATATLTKTRFTSGEVLGEDSVAPRQNHCCGDS